MEHPVSVVTAPDLADAVREVRTVFADRFGRAPEGVWSAPGRVNLIGEHVDYQQGLCMPMAISHRCVAAAALRDDDLVTVRSLQVDEADTGVTVALAELEPARLKGWSGYVLGVVWALREAMPQAAWRGMDLMVSSSVPLGAGLSSSAALECAVAAAVEDLLGLGTSPYQRIAAAIRAENDAVGAATGGLDQSASILAEAGHALLLDCRALQRMLAASPNTTAHTAADPAGDSDSSADTEPVARPVPWDLTAEGLALLITDTRASHDLADGSYEDRRRSTERAAQALGLTSLREAAFDDLDDLLPRIDDAVDRRRARHVITEIERVRRAAQLLEGGSVREVAPALGVLMDASHASLHEDFEVTVEELDLAAETARQHGAYGARMTGGGFGGSTIALVEAAQAEAIAAAIAEAFAARNLTPPRSFLAVPEDGARQEQ